MQYPEKLKDIYNNSFSVVKELVSIPETYQNYLSVIADKCYNQKGVFTVLVTLLLYKIFHPEQDIRYHKVELGAFGFSGRTFDTKYVTPTLRVLGLPAMAESGWLTRSLEQAHPYTLDYQGKINDKVAKEAFLHLLDYVQKSPHHAEYLLKLLFNKVTIIVEANKVVITPITNPDKLSIVNIIHCLEQQFSYKYHTSSGAKLPVLAFYAIYQSLITEIKRYNNCKLGKLGLHTTSDRNSKSAGDIEIFTENQQLFEAIEIKLDKQIDLNMVQIAYEKIQRFNPQRYCIFSLKPIKESDKTSIENLVVKIRQEHGCQVILNGVIPTLKYYLRLVESLERFIENYSKLIQNDTELKLVHREMWNTLVEKLNS
jgi:DNA (cytosine-5)-methyltransferase 1